MKICSMCEESLPESEFARHIKTKDRLQYHCRSCQKEYRKGHYEKNKRKYIDKALKWKAVLKDWWSEYRTRFKCATCGESHPACIHFHHHDDNKEGCVSKFIQDGCKEKALKELAKCTPLCANCHYKLHWG